MDHRSFRAVRQHGANPFRSDNPADGQAVAA